MITAYALTNGKVTASQTAAGAALPANTLWLDLESCTTEDIAAVSRFTHIRLPHLREARHLEQARQNYAEKGICHFSMPVIIGSQSEAPRTGTLHFALSSSLLITLRDGDSHAVRSYASRILSDSSQFQDPSSALVHLVQSFVARLADISEIISHDMEQVSRLVFHESLQRSKAPGRGKPDSWRKVLQGLGKTARLNHRLLATLSGIERMTAFASLPAQQEWIGKHHAELALIQRDLRALADQANAMVNEATFLLDAIVGAISIEQNNVIKIFSMVAVILMPPTMVASIYGMNFAHMPELDWLLGYPAALALMVLSGWLPWHWFRRNGWF